MRLMRRIYDLGRCSIFEMNGLSKGRTILPVFPPNCPFSCSVFLDSSFAYIFFHTGSMRDSSECAKWLDASHLKHWILRSQLLGGSFDNLLAIKLLGRCAAGWRRLEAVRSMDCLFSRIA